jgi:hypothetical protein
MRGLTPTDAGPLVPSDDADDAGALSAVDDGLAGDDI